MNTHSHYSIYSGAHSRRVVRRTFFVALIILTVAALSMGISAALHTHKSNNNAVSATESSVKQTAQDTNRFIQVQVPAQGTSNQVDQNNENHDATLHVTITGSSDGQPAQVTINGQDVPVPPSGSTSQVITNDGLTTSITASNSQSVSGESRNSSSTQTRVSVHSSSYVSATAKEGL